MAEGWSKALRADDFNAVSAGVDPHGLNPNAVKVMAEEGVDISIQASRHIDDFNPDELDIVVTVCGHAQETCPNLPSTTRVVHHAFDDPPALAKTAPSEEDALEMYRRVRDEIRAYIETLDPLESTA